MALTITIEVTDDGRMMVNGPIDNKLLSYGILVAAMFVIEKYEPKKVVTPTLVPPTDLRNIGRG